MWQSARDIERICSSSLRYFDRRFLLCVLLNWNGICVLYIWAAKAFRVCWSFIPWQLIKAALHTAKIWLSQTNHFNNISLGLITVDKYCLPDMCTQLNAHGGCNVPYVRSTHRLCIGYVLWPYSMHNSCVLYTMLKTCRTSGICFKHQCFKSLLVRSPLPNFVTI